MEYIEGLCKQEKTTADGEGKKIMKLIWATSCIEDEVSVDIQREELGGTDTTDHTEVSSLSVRSPTHANILNPPNGMSQ